MRDEPSVTSQQLLLLHQETLVFLKGFFVFFLQDLVIGIFFTCNRVKDKQIRLRTYKREIGQRKGSK